MENKNKQHLFNDEEILDMENVLTKDELEQLKFDEENLDGPYGTIPDWSKQFKADK